MTSQIFVLSLAAISLLMLLGWCIWRVFSPHPAGRLQTVLFFLVVFLTLAVLRQPSITWKHEFNQDESQMLAQAMRYQAHPVPWRDVDGTTSGPINSLVLAVPLYFGAPASWVTSRVILLGLTYLTLISIYCTLRQFMVSGEAQFSLMPTILFYAFATDSDFVNYSSETVSLLFLSVVIFMLCRGWCGGQPSKIRWFLVGLLLGAVPFAKLQAGLLALFFVIVGFGLLLVRCRRTGAGMAIRGEAVSLGLGGLAVPSVILGIVTINGAFGDFWKSYILASASYAAQESMAQKLSKVSFLLIAESDFQPYFISALAAMLFLLIAWWGKTARITGQLLWPLLVILTAMLVALFCLFIAGKAFSHYTLLLIPILGVFFGLVLAVGKTLLRGEGSQNSKRFHWWLAGLSVLAIGFQSCKASFWVYEFPTYPFHQQPRAPSLASQQILSASRHGDTISVWGWTPSFHVETRLMPATRDAISHYVISDGPCQEYYRERYLSDLMGSKPAFFVDAIAANSFMWNWSYEDTHESFPELDDFIDDNYLLWLRIFPTKRGRSGYPIRIYVLKERMAELKLARADLYPPADPFYEPH